MEFISDFQKIQVRLRYLKTAYPELRIGQIISNAMLKQGKWNDVFNIPDADLAEALSSLIIFLDGENNAETV